jgi:general secretion pathway protein G
MLTPLTHPPKAHRKGFTLIELIVVLAIIALLASIVAPRYLRSVDNAREASLKTSLNVMRDAIDKYMGDKGRYPDSLDELVKRGYIRAIPDDPVTGRSDSWQMLPPPNDSTTKGNMADVRSGAAGRAQNGQPYSAW